MITTLTGILAAVTASAALVGASARAEFGAHWNLVLALNVINAVIVVLYLWRIWREKLAPVQPRTRRDRA